jgi:hypothetical protein
MLLPPPTKTRGGPCVMQRTVFLLTCAAALTLLSSFANATTRIIADPGGRILDYEERFAGLRASGEQIIIDGACLSACTLAIGLLPPGQVCATSKAVLGFHAAWRLTERGGRVASPDATQEMLGIYPEQLRGWINRHGGLTPKMIFLRGRELAAIVPSCGSTKPRLASATFGDPGVLRSNTSHAQRVR